MLYSPSSPSPFNFTSFLFSLTYFHPTFPSPPPLPQLPSHQLVYQMLLWLRQKETHLAGKPLMTGAVPLHAIGSLPCEFPCIGNWKAVVAVTPTSCKKKGGGHCTHTVSVLLPFQLAAWIGHWLSSGIISLSSQTLSHPPEKWERV